MHYVAACGRMCADGRSTQLQTLLKSPEKLSEKDYRILTILLVTPSLTLKTDLLPAKVTLTWGTAAEHGTHNVRDVLAIKQVLKDPSD